MKANEKGVYNWNTVLDEMDVKKLSILRNHLESLEINRNIALLLANYRFSKRN